MMITTLLRIGQGFDIEVEATMVRDDARGAPEWIIEDGPFAVCPRTGRRHELAERYHTKAAGALSDAATATKDYER